MIDTIIFDIGDVLATGGHREMFLKRCWEYGERERALWEDYKVGKCTEREFWARSLEGSVNAGQEERIAQEFRAEFARSGSGPAYKIAFEAKAKGYSLGIISNHVSEWARTALEHLGLNAVFEGCPILISSEVGMKKPDSDIYERALDILERKSNPQMCVFLDDLERNVIAARNIGMHSIQCKDEAQVRRELKDLGVL